MSARVLLKIAFFAKRALDFTFWYGGTLFDDSMRYDNTGAPVPKVEDAIPHRAISCPEFMDAISQRPCSRKFKFTPGFLQLLD